ncbi:MAG: hypothetical protein ACYSP9_03015, partial [Planctomycetota bacterium]
MDCSDENMSETETQLQGQKRKPCDPARASVALGILGLVLGPAVIAAWPVWGSCGVVGLALGIGALYRTIKKREVPSSYIGPVVGAGLNSLVVLLALSAFVHPYPPRALRNVCGANLQSLGHAMDVYAHNNEGKYP